MKNVRLAVFAAGLTAASYWAGSKSNRTYTPSPIVEPMRDSAAQEGCNNAMPDVATRWQAIEKAEHESEQRAREMKHERTQAGSGQQPSTPVADQRFSILAKTISSSRLDSAPLKSAIEGSNATATAGMKDHGVVATEVVRGRNEIDKTLAEGAVEAVKQAVTGGTMPSGSAAGSPGKSAAKGTDKGAAKQPTPPANRNHKGKVQI